MNHSKRAFIRALFFYDKIREKSNMYKIKSLFFSIYKKYIRSNIKMSSLYSFIPSSSIIGLFVFFSSISFKLDFEMPGGQVGFL